MYVRRESTFCHRSRLAENAIRVIFGATAGRAPRVSEMLPVRGCERRQERNRLDSFVRPNGFIARMVRGSIVAKFIHRVISFIRFQRAYSAEE